MIPLLVPIGLGLIGGYLSKDSVETFAGGGLIAPNGKPSNLTPEQYKLVRTPKFKAWFGDWENDPENASKVVDVNGEPLVVYHGTNKEFTIFDLEKVGSNVDYGMWGSGFYFSPIKSFSKAYGEKILKVFLSIKNPFLRNPNIQGSKSKFKPVFGKEESIKLRYEIIESKFDGVMQWESGQKNLLSQIISFYPNQIKLADGTNTTFDANNPDIRYDGGGGVSDKLEAPKGYTFVIAGSHRSKKKIDRYEVAYISLYKIGGSQSGAGSYTLFMSDADYDKIKNITGVSKKQKLIRSDANWFSRKENNKVQEVFKGIAKKYEI